MSYFDRINKINYLSHAQHHIHGRCYDEKTLFGMAKHYKTGETLPRHLYDKVTPQTLPLAHIRTRHYHHHTVNTLAPPHLYDKVTPPLNHTFNTLHAYNPNAALV